MLARAFSLFFLAEEDGVYFLLSVELIRTGLAGSVFAF